MTFADDDETPAVPEPEGDKGYKPATDSDKSWAAEHEKDIEENS